MDFYDSRFNEDKITAETKIGIWVEGCENNLLDILDKKGTNFIIYVGNNLSEARKIFINPLIDFLIFFDGNTSKYVNQMLSGKLSFLELEKILDKFGDNILNLRKVKTPIFNILNLKDHLVKSKKNFKVFESKLIDSSWDKYGPSFWKGDQNYRDGFASTFGINYGHFTFKFDCDNPNTKTLEIFGKICSHSHDELKVDKNGSDVTLEINGKEIESRLLFFEPNRSDFIERFVIKNPQGLKKKGNISTFRIKPLAKHKNGLTIYGEGLTKKYRRSSLPIILFFKK